MYRTQMALAAELIGAVTVPAAATVLVLGDTAFEAEDIRRACHERGFGWGVPVNPERVLAGPKPRPKVASFATALSAAHFEAVRLVPSHGSAGPQRRGALRS